MEAVPGAGVVAAGPDRHAVGELVVERAQGSAAAFHGREFPSPIRPALWEFGVDRPTIVLGSRQTVDVVDLVACERAGVDVVRRRSGGGIVHVVPGELVWIDVVLPADDARWRDDVRASMRWMGERWVAALVALGLDVAGHTARPAAATPQLTVHADGMVVSPWSELLCFGGIGPGEVLLDGRKLVGISQRRTRAGARFQCAVHRRADPTTVAGLLAQPLPDLADLPDVAVLPELDAGDLTAALADALRS